MYYRKPAEEVIKEFNSSKEGLTLEQVKQNQEAYGSNQLALTKKDGACKIFIKQFQDLLVIILIIAAMISGLSGQWESTVVIVTVIVINAILGTVQTLKAEKSKRC